VTTLQGYVLQKKGEKEQRPAERGVGVGIGANDFFLGGGRWRAEGELVGRGEGSE